MKWRFEYKISDKVDEESGSAIRQWRLYVEGVEAAELLSMADAQLVIPEEHPVWEKLTWIFRDTHERLVLLPYEPFVPSRFVFDMLGPDFVARVLATKHERKVWSSSDNWTWLHIPGDDAR